jgi:membrane fusion protein, multidrug efflux system
MKEMNRYKISMKNPILFALLLAVPAFFTVTGCHSKEKDTAVVANKQETVEQTPATEVLILKKGSLSSSIQLPGELTAYQQVDLYAKENSYVKKLYVDVGSQVKAGQLLATLEAPELNSQLSAAESNLRSREAIYMASKANYDRLYETSKTPGTISGNDLDQAAARKSSDLAQLEAAKAAYREVQQTRNYLEIRAPFSGVISARNVNPGAYVGPSGKGSELPMFTLQQQDHLRLILSVPEAYTTYVTSKNAVRFTVKSLPEQQFTAQVKRLAGTLDPKLRSEHIEMDVYNSSKKLLPGMVAEVNLPLPVDDSSFIVPKTAVVNSTERVFVIRVNNNQAEWVDVKTGRESNGRIAVYGSLNPGDRIVKTATDEIRNGSALSKTKDVSLD